MSTPLKRRLICLALVLLTPPSAVTVWTQDDTRSYMDPVGRFTVRYPKKNWQALPGAGSTLATLAEKNGRATVQIEHVRLNQPLRDDEDRDLIVEIESELIRQRQPQAETIKSGLKRPQAPGMVVIDFKRPGVAGLEQVRQFSVVRDQDLFRILCVSRTTDFPKYEANFEQISASFSTN